MNPPGGPLPWPQQAAPKDEANALSATLLSCPDLSASTHCILTWLMRFSGAQGGALGWYEQGHAKPACQLLLQENGELCLDPSAHVQQSSLAAAMEEAIDQGVTLCHSPGHSSPWVTLAHRQHLQGQAGCLITLPLPGAQTPLGAVTLRLKEMPSALAVAEMALRLNQICPWLALQQQALRPWHWHARQAMRKQVRHWTSTPRRRKALVAAGVLMLAVIVLPLPDHVGAPARIEGEQQRVLVAPTDGFIKATHAHPGDQVKANQVLADLAEQDLKLARDKWVSQVAQYDNAYAAAMTRADRSEAALSLSRQEEAQAQLALIDEQLQRSQLRAPFDGVLIQGDLSQSIGAPVKQGDALMTVASTRQYRVILDVDEHDIARLKLGQTGSLRLSALPWDAVDLKVQRIVPLAVTREGRQVFEVQASFTQAVPPSWRPGLIGQAKVQTGYSPLLWCWIRPWIDRLALITWAWWG